MATPLPGKRKKKKEIEIESLVRLHGTDVYGAVGALLLQGSIDIVGKTVRPDIADEGAEVYRKRIKE